MAQQPPNPNDPQYQQYLEWQRQQAAQGQPQYQQPQQYPQQQPPPPQVIIIKQQRGKGCLIAIILLVVIGIAGAVAYSQAKQSGQLAFTVTYKVSGTAKAPVVTYNNATGGTEQKTSVALPWQQQYSFNEGSFFANITATNGTGGGDVTCQILVGSKVVKSSTSSGAFASASCTASVSASDGK